MTHPAFGYRTFDSEALHAMGEAFDLACEAHHNVLNVHDRDAIAYAILQAASDGEVRVDVLYEFALDSLNTTCRRSA